MVDDELIVIVLFISVNYVFPFSCELSGLKIYLIISKSFHECSSLEDENEPYCNRCLIELIPYFVLSFTSVDLLESILYIYMISIGIIGGFLPIKYFLVMQVRWNFTQILKRTEKKIFLPFLSIMTLILLMLEFINFVKCNYY